MVSIGVAATAAAVPAQAAAKTCARSKALSSSPRAASFSTGVSGTARAGAGLGRGLRADRARLPHGTRSNSHTLGSSRAASCYRGGTVQRRASAHLRVRVFVGLSYIDGGNADVLGQAVEETLQCRRRCRPRLYRGHTARRAPAGRRWPCKWTHAGRRRRGRRTTCCPAWPRTHAAHEERDPHCHGPPWPHPLPLHPMCGLCTPRPPGRDRAPRGAALLPSLLPLSPNSARTGCLVKVRGKLN